MNHISMAAALLLGLAVAYDEGTPATLEPAFSLEGVPCECWLCEESATGLYSSGTSPCSGFVAFVALCRGPT